MVKPVFADTCYFLALSTRRDRLHQQALALEASLKQPLLTTEWVLTEVADALAAPATRARFAALVMPRNRSPRRRLVLHRRP